MTVTVGEVRPSGRLRASLAGEIRAAMARQNLSGVGLAAILGKSQPYISRRLSGRLAFDIDDLEVISSILGMSPSELMAEASRRIEEPTTGLVPQAATDSGISRYAPAYPTAPAKLALVTGSAGDYPPVADRYQARAERHAVDAASDGVNNAYAA